MEFDYIVFTVLGGLFIAFIIFMLLEYTRNYLLNDSSSDNSNYKKYQIIAIIIIATPLILLDFLFNSIK